MSGVEVKIPLDQKAFENYILRAVDGLELTTFPSRQECEVGFFAEQYGDWLSQRSKYAAHLTCEQVSIEGVIGATRYIVVPFADGDREAAMLFKLSFA